jgi:2-polyprenyl-6-methoxyphenol hydroxylase-like FAD-dependent oxidoreductase
VASVLIVGAGQAGLQLGIGLLGDGHDVTVVSNRTSDDVRNGRLLSGQTMFGGALETERKLGIDLWQEECPQLEGKAFALFSPGDPDPVFNFAARLDKPGQSVDQRVKYPVWMDLFEQRGGRLEITQVGVPELERYAETHDLVVVAAGRDTGLFPKVPEKSPFDKPQKIAAICAVHGLTPRTPWDGVCITIVRGCGENIILPVLLPTGPGHLFVFQYFPGGPWDNWPEGTEAAFGGVKQNSVEEHLAHAKRLLKEYLPHMYERVRDCEAADPQANLRGGVTPVVREPVGQLPSGRLVLGIGDAVVVNDPLTAPGANSCALAADAYLEAIRAHGDAPYDRAFMEKTFYDFWNKDMRFITEWNNKLLGGTPEYVVRVLTAANEAPEISHRWVNGYYRNRADFFEWLGTPEKAEAFLEQIESSRLAAHT